MRPGDRHKPANCGGATPVGLLINATLSPSGASARSHHHAPCRSKAPRSPSNVSCLLRSWTSCVTTTSECDARCSPIGEELSADGLILRRRLREDEYVTGRCSRSARGGSSPHSSRSASSTTPAARSLTERLLAYSPPRALRRAPRSGLRPPNWQLSPRPHESRTDRRAAQSHRGCEPPTDSPVPRYRHVVSHSTATG